MGASEIERRLDKLEAVQVATGEPAYLSFPDEAALEAFLVEHCSPTGKPCKVYIGISPDDWDEPSPIRVREHSPSQDGS